MTKEKRTRGRPKAINPSDSRLPHIRVKQEQLDDYRSEACKCGLSLSAWVRMILDNHVTNQNILETEKKLGHIKKPDHLTE